MRKRKTLGYIVEDPLGGPMHHGEDGILWLAGLRHPPTVFSTRSKARAAIRRTNREADRCDLPWRRDLRIQRIEEETG